MVEGTRRERRSGSRREKIRVSWEKTDKFLALRAQGASRGAISASLGLSTATVTVLMAIAESGEGGKANNA